MTAIRRELDGLRAQHGAADLFTATLEELDAVRDKIADAIAAKTKERVAKLKLKKINQQTGDIFEAC